MFALNSCSNFSLSFGFGAEKEHEQLESSLMRQKTRIKDHESKKDTAEKKLKNYMSLALKAHNILNEQDAQEIS